MQANLERVLETIRLEEMLVITLEEEVEEAHIIITITKVVTAAQESLSLNLLFHSLQ